MYKNLHIRSAYRSEIDRAKTWRKFKAHNTAENRRRMWSEIEQQKTAFFSRAKMHDENTPYINSFTNLILTIMEKELNKAVENAAIENGKETAINWVIPQPTIEEILEGTLNGFIVSLCERLEIKRTPELLNLDWLAIFETRQKEQKKKMINDLLSDSSNEWLLDVFKNYNEKRTAKLSEGRKQRSAERKQEKQVLNAYEILAKQYGITAEEAKARFIEMIK